MRVKSVAIGAVVALSLTLSGCGGNDDEKKAADAIAKDLTTSQGGMKLKESEAQCVGEGMVDKLGVEKLKKYKLITDDLGSTGNSTTEFSMPAEDADASAEVMVKCADLTTLLVDQMGGDQMSDEVKSCVDDKLDDATMKKLFSAMFQGDKAAATEAMTPIQECATAS